MLPDSSDEIFKSAYANVGLYADTVWLNGEHDAFQKANQELWVLCHRVRSLFDRESNDLSERIPYPVTKQIRTVRDTIPFSRLAHYGNFEYDEDRERLYAPDSTTSQNTEKLSYDFEEIWMYPEVEEEFRKLTCTDSPEYLELWTQELTPFTPSSPQAPKKDKEDQIPRRFFVHKSWASVLLKKYPRLAKSFCDSLNQSLFSEDVAHISEPHRIEPYDIRQFPTPRYSVDSVYEHELNLKITSPEVRAIWSDSVSSSQYEETRTSCRSVQAHLQNKNPVDCNIDTNKSFAHRPPPPTLNANVPEFHPKTNQVNQYAIYRDVESSRRFFPSAREVSDQSDLFPYVHAIGNDSVDLISENTNEFGRISYTSTVVTTGLVSLTTFTATETRHLQQPNAQQLYCLQYPSPVSTVICRQPQQMINSSFQQHVSTVVYAHSQTSSSFGANSLNQETSCMLNNQQLSAPRNIPVYQRPPEFYMQNQDATSSGNATSNRRRQGGGVDYSNLILLTRGSKGHNKNQNVKQQQLNLKHVQTEVSTPIITYQQSPGSALFGRDIFSNMSFRNPAREDENSFATRDTSYAFGEHFSLPQDNFINRRIKIEELPAYATSVKSWLDVVNGDRAEDSRNVDKLIGNFNCAEAEIQQQTENEGDAEVITKAESKFDDFLSVKEDHFPPIVPSTPTDASTSSISDKSSLTSSANSYPETPLTSNAAVSKVCYSQPGANVRRRLYSDVTATGCMVTTPVSPLVDSGLDRRYDELERQAMEQYRPSEESLGQRKRSSEVCFQELERQAVEQYSGSSSDFSSGTRKKSGTSTCSVGEKVETPHCSGEKRCNPAKNACSGEDQTPSPPSGRPVSTSPSMIQGGTSPNLTGNRGCCTGTGCNTASKRGQDTLSSSRSHQELPGSSMAVSSAAGFFPSTPNEAPSRIRPAATSKSLTAIGSNTPQITISSKVNEAAADKGGDGIHSEPPMNKRRLVLITPVKKRLSLPSTAEIEGGEVGPQLILAQGGRGVGHHIGSTQRPRRLVTDVLDASFPKPKGHFTGQTGVKMTKSQTQQLQRHRQGESIPLNLEGGGDQLPFRDQHNQENNPNVQRTQVFEEPQPVFENSNEVDSQCIDVSDGIVMNSADNSKIPEAWVHSTNYASNEISSETFIDNETLHSTSTVELERPHPSKPPPWMKKQRKKRSAPGNKKKRNKLSGKRVSCLNKVIREVSSACDLTCNFVIENEINTPKSESYCSIHSRHITKNNAENAEEFPQDDKSKIPILDLESMDTCEKTYLQKSSHRKPKLNRKSSVKMCVAKRIAKTNMDSGDFVGNSEEMSLIYELSKIELSFGSFNTIPIIPLDFHINTVPENGILDYISDYKLELKFFVKNKVRLMKRRSKEFFVGGDYDEISELRKIMDKGFMTKIYTFSPEMMAKHMNLTLENIKIPEYDSDLPETSRTMSLLDLLECRKIDAQCTKDQTENKSLQIAKKIQYSIYKRRLLLKELHILKLTQDILILTKEISWVMKGITKGCSFKSHKLYRTLHGVKMECIEPKSTNNIEYFPYDRPVRDILNKSLAVFYVIQGLRKMNNGPVVLSEINKEKSAAKMIRVPDPSISSLHQVPNLFQNHILVENEWDRETLEKASFLENVEYTFPGQDETSSIMSEENINLKFSETQSPLNSKSTNTDDTFLPSSPPSLMTSKFNNDFEENFISSQKLDRTETKNVENKIHLDENLIQISQKVYNDARNDAHVFQEIFAEDIGILKSVNGEESLCSAVHREFMRLFPSEETGLTSTSEDLTKTFIAQNRDSEETNNNENDFLEIQGDYESISLLETQGDYESSSSSDSTIFSSLKRNLKQTASNMQLGYGKQKGIKRKDCIRKKQNSNCNIQ